MKTPGIWFLLVGMAAPVCAVDLTESFGSDPSGRGWRMVGDASLFRWDAPRAALAVTWDSSRSNSFFHLPLGTVLGRTDAFSLTFSLHLQDIRIGSTPGKPMEFPIAIGLIHRQITTNASAYRGAGVSSVYGVKNLVEWNFFPDGGFGDTWATTVVSSNNVFAYGHTFPVPLIPGDHYQVSLAYTPSNQLLRTTALRNGQPMDALESVSLAALPDFRVDAFSITSYSDAVQIGPPAYHGSVLAHGWIDDVVVSLPPPPVTGLVLQRTGEIREASFIAQSGWTHQLERSLNLSRWQAASAPAPGTGARTTLRDTNAPAPALAGAFYRIRSERP